ncbi:MAG TPA: SH3 domain-containing protein [Anaerolineales bacterium]|nr:SH3 domain-containing protein [Anaerolineales bacterium]
MKRRIIILVFLISIVLSSCTMPGNGPSIDTPSPQPTQNIPITGVTTPTSIPIETLVDVAQLPTATLTSTPSVILAAPREQPVNCRFGPDISYAIVGALIAGRQAEVIGKNIDVTWVYVRNPSDPSNNCWLSVDFIELNGDTALLPVVGPPEIMVTDIQVSVDPSAMNVACDAFPQSVIISAEVTTNGPTIVTWFWESSVGVRSDQKQLLFEAGGTKMAQDFYQVDRAGDYSIQVGSILPNLRTGEATFKAICTP